MPGCSERDGVRGPSRRPEIPRGGRSWIRRSCGMRWTSRPSASHAASSTAARSSRARPAGPRRRGGAGPRLRPGAEAEGDRDGELGRRRPEALLRRLGQAVRDRLGHQGGRRRHRPVGGQDAGDGRGEERHVGRLRFRLRHLPRAGQAGLLRRVRLRDRGPEEGAAGLRLQVGHRELPLQLRARLRQGEVRQQPARTAGRTSGT